MIIVLPVQVAASIRDISSRILTFWNYNTISRGKASLFEILKNEFPGVDLSKYIFFTSLRTYDYQQVKCFVILTFKDWISSYRNDLCAQQVNDCR